MDEKGADAREMTGGMDNALTLLGIEGALEKHKEKMDRRRSRGRNHYADFVFGAFEIIQKFLAQGCSVNKIFEILVEEGVFGDNADPSNFYRAWKREQLRRGSRSGNAVTGRKNKVKNEKDGKKQERDVNERVVSLHDRDVSISVDVPDDLKDGKGSGRYSFSEYPEYIQEAIKESERNGTLLEDRERNSRMIQEWIDQQRSEKENGRAK